MKIEPEKKTGAGKRQHIVPKFIVKNFAGNDGYVHALMRRNRKLIKISPGNIMLRNGENDFDTFAGTAMTIEYAISRVESMIAPVIETILEKEILTFEETERRALGNLLSLQMMRDQICRASLGVKSIENIKAQVNSFGGEIRLESFSDDQIEKLFRELVCTNFDDVFSQHSSETSNMDFFLLRAPAEKEFYLSDQPIVYDNLSMGATAPWKKLEPQRSFERIFMPISPGLAVGATTKGANDLLQTNIEDYISVVAWRRRQGEKYIGPSAKELLLSEMHLRKTQLHLAAVKSGCPIDLTVRETDTLNKQQASGAFEQIVSKSKKVQQLRHFLKGLPHPSDHVTGMISKAKG